MTSTSMKRATAATCLTALALAGAGCDQLLAAAGQNGSPELAPEAQIGALELRHSPPLEDLGAYYCPQVIDDPFVALGCTVALGPAPPKSSLVFEFGVVLNIHNPNDIPVPALDVLLALTLFNDVDSEALGAICISLCGTDDPTCDGTPRPGACEDNGDGVRSIEDFVNRLPGLIADIASGQAAAELRKGTIAAGGDVSLDLAFILGIDQALTVFEKAAVRFVQGYLDGGDPALDIPVRADGTVYFRLPVLGRIGVDYGPLTAVWHVL